MIELADVEAAAERLVGVAHRTPVATSRTLDELLSARLFLKCESVQKTGSFKPRGALNKVLSLSPGERAKGIVTVSAGNHAQGVAFSAHRLGLSALIVMPITTPSTTASSDSRLKRWNSTALHRSIAIVARAFASMIATVPLRLGTTVRKRVTTRRDESPVTASPRGCSPPAHRHCR